jgi:hypothetical protein
MAVARPRWVVPVLGIVLALAVVATRLLVDARAAYQMGSRAELAGKHRDAIRHYEDTVRLYVPGSPFVRYALDRLDGIAAAATAARNLDLARAALEAERGALLSTRSVYVPYASRLSALEQELARLLALAEDPTGSDLAERAAWHAERLARRPGPSLVYVVLALAGLGLWLGGSVTFFTRGLDASLRLRPRAAVLCGAAFLVGMSLFLMGLRLA